MKEVIEFVVSYDEFRVGKNKYSATYKMQTGRSPSGEPTYHNFLILNSTKEAAIENFIEQCKPYCLAGAEFKVAFDGKVVDLTFYRTPDGSRPGGTLEGMISAEGAKQVILQRGQIAEQQHKAESKPVTKQEASPAPQTKPVAKAKAPSKKPAQKAA